MHGPTVDLIGQATQAALRDAVKAWRNEYAPNAAFQGLLEGHIRRYDISITGTKLGTAQITIEMQGKKYGTDDLYWYHATMVAGELRLDSVS